MNYNDKKLKNKSDIKYIIYQKKLKKQEKLDKKQEIEIRNELNLQLQHYQKLQKIEKLKLEEQELQELIVKEFKYIEIETQQLLAPYLQKQQELKIQKFDTFEKINYEAHNLQPILQEQPNNEYIIVKRHKKYKKNL